jgi:hypothetical protein
MKDEEAGHPRVIVGVEVVDEVVVAVAGKVVVEAEVVVGADLAGAKLKYT